MSNPTKGAWRKLKRIARYFIGVRRIVQEFRADGDERVIEVFTDSDWAGCRETRKSVSGGVICLGGDVVKTWSKSQGSISLSSGEAEYYALVKGSAEALGMKSLMADMGIQCEVRMRVDSSAAKGIASRRGVGK
eukprot:9261497-Lingulodinium_polyedra.AAC.1